MVQVWLYSGEQQKFYFHPKNKLNGLQDHFQCISSIFINIQYFSNISHISQYYSYSDAPKPWRVCFFWCLQATFSFGFTFYSILEFQKLLETFRKSFGLLKLRLRKVLSGDKLFIFLFNFFYLILLQLTYRIMINKIWVVNFWS